ncbi:MAG TPA: hypothetical protein V6C97_08835 [Oculatellaceae cyanobacterium]
MNEVDPYSTGQKMRRKQAEKEEQKLVEQPSNVQARTKLLGYYGNRLFDNVDCKKKYIEHCLWIIANNPTCSDDLLLSYVVSKSALWCSEPEFEHAKKIWLEQIEQKPSNGLICGNAGFFIIWRDFGLGEELLNRARALDPTSHLWPSRLHDWYFFKFRFEADTVDQKKMYAKLCIETGRDTAKLISLPLVLEQTEECEKFLGKEGNKG